MNIVYVIQIILINFWVLYNLKNGLINKLVSPKFNDIIFITGLSLILFIICFFYLLLKKRIRPYVKLDLVFFIITLLITILFFGDKTVQSKSIIKNKYKGTVLFSKFDSAIQNTGSQISPEKSALSKKTLEKKIKKTIEPVLYTDKYISKDLMRIYNELEKITDEKNKKKLRYKVEVIGQPYEPADNQIELFEKEFMLVRFLMVCCVADMVPIAIVVENKANVDFSDDEQWFKIKGTIEFIKEEKSGSFFGFLTDDQIEK
ncbi:MAG TPA: hypothetical protein PLQ81_05285, partial [bacterium]|nr:hypothetical protein [bacterium]